jgi:hypothetical protein
MHQNTFITTADVNKYLLSGHYSGGLEVFANASKHDFNHCRPEKNIFLTDMFLVARKYAQMHQNTFFNHS